MTSAFNAYAALALAIVFEVTASAFLQQSAQFTRPWPTLAMVLFYVASFYALSVAIRVIPLEHRLCDLGRRRHYSDCDRLLRAVPPDAGRRGLRRHRADRVRGRGHQPVLADDGALMPASAYTRAKQPEQVRRALLDHAAAIAMDHGVSGITVQAVAAAAGVTKGGLFHHFGSKQALIEGLFADLLARVDAEIDAAIEADPKPRGSFTRAYVNAVFTGKAFGFATPWAALSMVVVTDPSLRRLWNDWMKARLKRHRTTDAAPELHVVRLAADGAWLSYITTGQTRMGADLRAVHDRLIAQTYRRG